MTDNEAVSQARSIVRMATAPFVPADLARAITRVSPKVGAMIEAVASQECCRLKDGTDRVVLA